VQGALEAGVDSVAVRRPHDRLLTGIQHMLRLVRTCVCARARVRACARACTGQVAWSCSPSACACVVCTRHGSDVDAEELFRAFFGQTEGGGGAGGGGFGGFEQFFQQASGMRGGAAARGGAGDGHNIMAGGVPAIVANVLRSCSHNPHMIILLLCVVASLFTVSGWLMSRPYLIALPFLVPSNLRRPAAVLFFFLLTSGVLM
jgi:hypothetical protein